MSLISATMDTYIVHSEKMFFISIYRFTEGPLTEMELLITQKVLYSEQSSLDYQKVLQKQCFF